MIFRQKPINVEAEQFNGTDEQAEKIGIVRTWSTVELFEAEEPSDGAKLITIYGDIPIHEEDWLVKDSNQEWQVVQKDDFEARYEKASTIPKVFVGEDDPESEEIVVFFKDIDGEDSAVFVGPSRYANAQRFIDLMS